ncbi:restriction endonuclease, partial [Salinimicrobium sp. CDJ15-91]|nr:restriction endonuclease [Salinimicrobium oceani]
MPVNQIISGAGPGIYPSENFEDVRYCLAFLNSQMSYYLTDCLNPTVNTTQGDLKRIPFVKPNEEIRKEVSTMADMNIALRKFLCSFSWINIEFSQTPFYSGIEADLKKRVKSFFDIENNLNTRILLNEAIINKKIFDVYELTDSDKEMVLAKQGESIGGLPVNMAAKLAYINNKIVEFPIDNLKKHIEALSIKEFSTDEIEKIKNEFPQLYQSNNDLEEFC